MNHAVAVSQGSMREHNLALVAQAVFAAVQPCSRAAIAAATGLTRATVSTLVDQLIAARIVDELPPAARQRAGRPAVPLVPAARTLVALGLEVNVDHAGGLVLDLAGTVVAEHVEPGDFHDSDPAEVLARLGHIARDLIDGVRADGMTVAGARLALPGLGDASTGRLHVAPNLGWSDLDPTRLLGALDDDSDTDGGVAVGVANEAKLAALAQRRHPLPGGGAVPASYLYVSGDVGVGSAIVVEDRLFGGKHGWAGELGHVVVDPGGPRCRCGATGCLERFAGKDALLRAAGLPRTADTTQLVATVRAGDPAAVAGVESAGAALGSALADYVNLVDVDVVLLGGIYPDLLEVLRPPIEAGLRARVLAAPWSDLVVAAAPVAERAALTGGAGEVLRAVVDDPSPWLPAAY